MKSSAIRRSRGFTVFETVIAIGVLAVLLTGFMVVFTPAAEGIRKSINVQQADRMASTLEQELVTLRSEPFTTGFNKAFTWIENKNKDKDALLVYQYRGSMTTLRNDKTPTPVPSVTGLLPGKDYVIVPMVRLRSDATNLKADLEAVEGGVYLVKCTQLVFNSSQLVAGTAGKIVDPISATMSTTPDDYPEAVIAFAAEFHLLPAKTYKYIKETGFTAKFNTVKNPIFVRNLAVRR